MLRKDNLMANIRWKLNALTYHAMQENRLGLTNINHAAEPFYAGLLSIVLDSVYPGIHLTNLNALKMNFPAIDLADLEREVCVQVTTTEGREKIQHTLDKYFEHNLDKYFDRDTDHPHGFQRLIVLIIGDRPRYRNAFTLNGNLSFNHETDVWDTPYLLAQIEAQDISVVEKVDAYLRRNMELQDMRPKVLNLEPSSRLPANGFVGRERELAQIDAEMQNGTNPIFLSGLGGIGKTELAVRFGKNYQNQGRGNVYMVTFQTSFYKTLMQEVAPKIPGLLENTKDEKLAYDTVIHHLKQLDHRDILIVDNADGEEDDFSALMDETYHEILALPFHLIITTRCTPEYPVEVAAMPHTEAEKPLYQLFRNHRVNLAPEKMDALIYAVQGHTMTVDLMARMLKANRSLTPELLIQKLRDGSISEQEYRAVGTTYPSQAQRSIDGHLRALFKVVDVSEETKQMLSCAVLIPQGGMDYDTFRNALPENTLAALEEQIDHGWLGFDFDTRLLTIHPVIRLVCRIDIERWKDYCPEFLTRLHENYHEKNFKVGIYEQMAQVYISAIENRIPEEAAMWHFRAGWYLCKQGQNQEALKYEQEVLGVREKMEPVDELLIAASCNDIGLVHNALAQYEEALVCFERAYEIRLRLLTERNADTARSCNNVGDAYHCMGKYDLARDFKEKALTIFQEILAADDPDLATSYNNVGSTYGALGDHKKALEHKLNALAIWEKVLPPEHPDLAKSYNNVGGTYGDLGDHEKALGYLLKALVIWEKVLPLEHPDLAQSYNNVGATYGYLGDHKQALEYLLKALAIRETVLPENHPDLASSYNNVAMGYYYTAMACRVPYLRQNNLKTAVQYAQKAVKTAEKRLSGKHPDLLLYKENLKGLKRAH